MSSGAGLTGSGAAAGRLRSLAAAPFLVIIGSGVDPANDARRADGLAAVDVQPAETVGEAVVRPQRLGLGDLVHEGVGGLVPRQRSGLRDLRHVLRRVDVE